MYVCMYVFMYLYTDNQTQKSHKKPTGVYAWKL